MRLSSTDLETIRQRPSQTKLDLFIFQPRTVMQCLVNNASIAKGAREITYDTVSLGSYVAVEPGMTLLVGSVAGASDLGRIRIKSVTVTKFTVSENSNVRWADNAFLTVLRYFEVWPVFPRIIQNPSSTTSLIFYKDYDIPYSNQNSILGTVINAGAHQPVFLENGTGTAYYSSTGTFNLIGDSLSYNWAFEGGTPTGSTSANPGYINYTSVGDYVTRLTVTSGSGAVDTTYRYVSAKNKIGEGATTPVVRWQMTDLVGSRGEAGYSVEFKVFDTVSIDENAVVMLRSDDWFGDTHTSLGGNYPNASKTFFVGYIESDSISYNHQFSYTTFRASSVTALMKKFTGFSASVTSTANPGTWFELFDMDVRRAIYHYLRWHTTVLSSTDLNFVGTDYKIQYFDVDRTSLFDAINSVLQGALSGSLSADRQGRLWAEVDPKVYSNPTGTFTPVMDISKRDWMDEPNIQERINDDVSYIEHGGVAYSGVVTGTYGAFLSGAPGVTPSFSGNVEQLTGLAISGQTHLNSLTGHLWANRNQTYPTVSMDMGNPLRNLDIAPQEVVSIKIDPSDTVKNVAIDGLYIPSSISWKYDPQKLLMIPQIEFTGLVNGVPGDTIIIPDLAYDFDDNFDFNFDFNIPPFPPIDIPTLVITNPLASDVVVILVKNYGMFYTDDFTSDSPSWYPCNFGLPPARLGEIINVEMTASGRLYCQLGRSSGIPPGAPSYEPYRGNAAVYSAEYAGAVWGVVFDAISIGNPEGFAFPRGQSILGFGVDREADDGILILGGVTVTIGSNFLTYPFLGTSSGVTWNSTRDFGSTAFFDTSTHAYITKGASEWVITWNNLALTIQAMRTDIAATTSLNLTTIALAGSGISTRSKKSQNSVVIQQKITFDDGIIWNTITGSASPYNQANDLFQSTITNDTGTQIVRGIASNPGLVYSNNSGATWSSGSYANQVSSVWHLGLDHYLFSGESGSVSGLYNLNTTPQIVDKTGNLRNIITGSFSIEVIRSYE